MSVCCFVETIVLGGRQTCAAAHFACGDTLLYMLVVVLLYQLPAGSHATTVMPSATAFDVNVSRYNELLAVRQQLGSQLGAAAANTETALRCQVFIPTALSEA